MLMKWYAGAALLLLMAVVFDLGLLAYAMYAVLGVMIVSRLLARHWSEKVEAVRETNRQEVDVGARVAIVITLRNTGPLPIAWLLVEDLLPRRSLIFNPPNLRVHGHRLELFMLKGRAGRTLTYQLDCNRRGYYQIGPLMLETGDLFGLHRRWRILTEPMFLLVYPQVVPLAGYDIESRRPIGEVRLSHRLYEDPTRVAGVRKYQPGDPLNRVHWHATARTGTLHSKVYEPSTVRGATILLEFHAAAYAPRHEPYRSELAVTAAASLAGALYEMGQQVGLVTNGRDAADRVRTEGWSHEDIPTRRAARAEASMRESSDRLRPLIVETRRGVTQFHRLRTTLARVELSTGLTLDQLAMEAAGHMPRDASVVAILPEVTPAQAAALANLRRHGFAVTAILNLYESWDFAEAAGLLLSVGIRAHHLKDEDAVTTVCREFVLR